jgi:hypothetical protein
VVTTSPAPTAIAANMAGSWCWSTVRTVYGTATPAPASDRREARGDSTPSDCLSQDLLDQGLPAFCCCWRSSRGFDKHQYLGAEARRQLWIVRALLRPGHHRDRTEAKLGVTKPEGRARLQDLLDTVDGDDALTGWVWLAWLTQIAHENEPLRECIDSCTRVIDRFEHSEPGWQLVEALNCLAGVQLNTDGWSAATGEPAEPAGADESIGSASAAHHAGGSYLGDFRTLLLPSPGVSAA